MSLPQTQMGLLTGLFRLMPLQLGSKEPINVTYRHRVEDGKGG